MSVFQQFIILHCKENSAKSETENISMHQFTIVYFCLMVFYVQMHNKISISTSQKPIDLNILSIKAAVAFVCWLDSHNAKKDNRRKLLLSRGKKRRKTFATLIHCNCVLGVRTWHSVQYFCYYWINHFGNTRGDH